MKRLLLIPLAVVLTLLGFVGLIIPILPGFLFLLLALVCMAMIFPQLRQRLETVPRMRRFFHRVEQTRCLGLARRCKLWFWAALEMLTPSHR